MWRKRLYQGNFTRVALKGILIISLDLSYFSFAKSPRKRQKDKQALLIGVKSWIRSRWLIQSSGPRGQGG